MANICGEVKKDEENLLTPKSKSLRQLVAEIKEVQCLNTIPSNTLKNKYHQT